LPLVFFFPGSGSQANVIWNTYDASNPGLRQLADSFVIKPGTTGYLLISVHPLNHHWPSPNEDGAKNDFIYRSLTSPDFNFFDSLIDTLVASGQVDPNYIFLSGWSNGCQTSQYYGITRNNLPTFGGNRVRAVASYSGADPYGPIAGDVNCAVTQYPTSNLPIYSVGRDCDLVACPTQQVWYNTTLPTNLNNNVSKWVLINTAEQVVYSCVPTPNCSVALQTSNHITWPTSQTIEFLNWFRDSPPLTAATTITNGTGSSSTGVTKTSVTSGSSSGSGTGPTTVQDLTCGSCITNSTCGNGIVFLLQLILFLLLN